ncbi:probable L-cysteine desulfhydrase, chloroplastic [Octopus vulgaris]|uniref:Probable L-cysteine desulfhydrase, chloroplastic n=1 Tax=Octopus vulgaris TaxID=6645 RepID=A0AA36BQ83_OCTVU|nr:probable L-cysteine desulfhydrase, chloroplastic [Octopus vulgaris]
MARRDFGSFHASNVQELLELPDEKYEAPHFPVDRPSFEEYKNNPPEFGKEMRKKHFLLEPEVTFINHGAFGAVLSEALENGQKYQRHTELQPLRFLDRELFPLLVDISRQLAKFVGCDPTDLVLVSNATTATSTVVRGIPFTKEDTIFFLNTTYGAVKKLLREVSRLTGVHLQEETVELPLTNRNQIIELVRDKLKPGTRLAIFDHIASNFALTMPLKEIIEICHQRKVAVYVDGAHALGSQKLNLRSLRPTYYTSNAHKWLSTPKGCAFMYVDKSRQDAVRPLVVSHGYGAGFNSEFIWTVQYLSEKWSTPPVAPSDMFDSMALIQLPDSLHFVPPPLTEVDFSCAESIQNELYHKYNIEVPIKPIQGCLYVRISGHIYNEMSDYEKLAEAVLEITVRRKQEGQVE